MLSKLISLITIIVVIYLGLVFLAPDFIDTYGSISLNEKIRMAKRASELDRTLNTTWSLIDKATDIAKPYIDESKNVVNESKDTIINVNNVLTEKTEQAKQVIESAQDTYNKAQETKSKIDWLSNFGTGK